MVEPSLPTAPVRTAAQRRIDRQRAAAMPLSMLPADRQERIHQQVAADSPPPKWLYFGERGDRRPLAAMMSRAWYEWHWARGVDPEKKRDPVPLAVRAAVIARDGYICQLCGGDIDREDLHLDHIVPYSKGGPSTVANLQATHAVCNMRKGARIDGTHTVA